MVLRTYIGAMHGHLKNNTPVNTEVLWSGGGSSTCLTCGPTGLNEVLLDVVVTNPRDRSVIVGLEAYYINIDEPVDVHNMQRLFAIV